MMNLHMLAKLGSGFGPIWYNTADAISRPAVLRFIAQQELITVGADAVLKVRDHVSNTIFFTAVKAPFC